MSGECGAVSLDETRQQYTQYILSDAKLRGPVYDIRLLAGQLVAMAGNGTLRLDPIKGTAELLQFNQPDKLAQVPDTAVFDDALWFATSEGLIKMPFTLFLAGINRQQ